MGSNDKIASAIDFVLHNVPEPVTVFVLARCIFTSMDDAWGGCCYKVPLTTIGVLPPPAFWLIEISEDTYCKSSFRYRKCSQNTLRYIVARELAHAYMDFTEAERQDEAAAIQLAEQWGFRGATGSLLYGFYSREKQAAEAEKKWDEFTRLLR